MLIECNIFVVEIDSEDKRKGIEIKKSKKKEKTNSREIFQCHVVALVYHTQKKNNKRRL